MDMEVGERQYKVVSITDHEDYFSIGIRTGDTVLKFRVDAFELFEGEVTLALEENISYDKFHFVGDLMHVAVDDIPFVFVLYSGVAFFDFSKSKLYHLYSEDSFTIYKFVMDTFVLYVINRGNNERTLYFIKLPSSLQELIDSSPEQFEEIVNDKKSTNTTIA